jgi:hypothetical protein
MPLITVRWTRLMKYPQTEIKTHDDLAESCAMPKGQVQNHIGWCFKGFTHFKDYVNHHQHFRDLSYAKYIQFNSGATLVMSSQFELGVSPSSCNDARFGIQVAYISTTSITPMQVLLKWSVICSVVGVQIRRAKCGYFFHTSLLCGTCIAIMHGSCQSNAINHTLLPYLEVARIRRGTFRSAKKSRH